ncbi:hypothetical protein Pmani_025981 [Petrolisthes manimaculis]|uniref:Uncharacterized protein n=1 Tax=Petrolisthes manimaculis TaxID=1843537 RepID=A0AAE1TYB6_9EUCA|nr:hypothetical protein Pmani_025981 [Petrolisthes manimaculis]
MESNYSVTGSEVQSWGKRKWGNDGLKDKNIKHKTKKMKKAKEESPAEEFKLDSWGTRKWGVKEKKRRDVKKGKGRNDQDSSAEEPIKSTTKKLDNKPTGTGNHQTQLSSQVKDVKRRI